MAKQNEQSAREQPMPGAAQASSSSPATSLLATERISVREASKTTKVSQRAFPGPRNADSALRVAVERRAYADLIAHAKESLEVEVCGVLAGELCEDEEGIFVHVQAAVRGTAAAEASTHVTFTQTTWNRIHQTLERDYPKLRIVGWYHTHPGFGVEFSDMDLFIQKNFFSGPAQIALVTDPLSGAVAICLNAADGARYLPRFWVDGREQPCQIPSRSGSTAISGAPSTTSNDSIESSLRNLEARLGQLMRTIDEQQASYHRFLLFCGLIFCLAIIGTAGYFIYHTYTSKYEPPKLMSYVPVPVQVGDKVALIGLQVVGWELPKELNALMLQMELLKQLAAEKEAQEAAKKAGTNAPAETNSVNETPKQK